MKESTAMYLVVTGLVLTIGGAGGVENSMDTQALLQSLAAAVTGLAIMACGVVGLQTK